MTWTGYVDAETGMTLYAKPRPIVSSPWATDAVDFTENGTTGEYSATLDDEVAEYVVYENINGTPGNEADTDPKIGVLTKAADVEALSDFQAQLDQIQEKTSLIDTGHSYLVPTRFNGTRIELFTEEDHAFTFSTADLTSKTIKVVFKSKSGTTLLTVAEDDLSKTTSSVTIDAGQLNAVTDVSRKFNWSIRDVTTDEVYKYGDGSVENVA